MSTYSLTLVTSIFAQISKIEKIYSNQLLVSDYISEEIARTLSIKSEFYMKMIDTAKKQIKTVDATDYLELEESIRKLMNPLGESAESERRLARNLHKFSKKKFDNMAEILATIEELILLYNRLKEINISDNSALGSDLNRKLQSLEELRENIKKVIKFTPEKLICHAAHSGLYLII